MLTFIQDSKYFAHFVNLCYRKKVLTFFHIQMESTDLQDLFQTTGTTLSSLSYSSSAFFSVYCRTHLNVVFVAKKLDDIKTNEM